MSLAYMGYRTGPTLYNKSFPAIESGFCHSWERTYYFRQVVQFPYMTMGCDRQSAQSTSMFS